VGESYRGGLDTEIQFVKGVGPKLATLFHKLGVRTVEDLLFHLPRRYEDRTQLPPINSLRPGQWATVKGRISHVDSRPISGGRVVVKAMLTQERSGIALVFFNQPWIKKKLQDYRGDVIAYGQVKEGNAYLEMAAPEFELLDEDDTGEAFAQIVPVYPSTEGLTQFVIRRAIANVLDQYLGGVSDRMPPSAIKHFKLADVQWSLRQIHRPESEVHRLEARRRLVFEEFFVMQMGLAMQRSKTQAEAGIAFKLDHDALQAEMRQMLPFELTGAQKRVISEVWRDLESEVPMNRLVQGDVGSGKTAVAACAMLAAVRDGYQAAMMAPTEILAEQHAFNLRNLFEPLGIEVALLVGKQGIRERRSAQAKVASGEAHIAVGTHALIQEGIEFEKLGLAVVDEQHRFGVLQRAALRMKGLNPDVLVMTATPIPRTLTMTIYGDLDVSIIDELPPGRTPVKTHWRRTFERNLVYKTVRTLVEEGRQAYFVCPMVSENEKMQTQAAEELFQRLSTTVYSDLRVGLLHGQMKPKDKESTMNAFRAHELDILVATTVIEVGVDVPNASVMVIEDANRFGLSQLHQLRGRVGRGQYASFCLLVADTKSEEAEVRLMAMVGTNDGFKIAEEDLKLRGPGELAGTRQSGNLDFKVADLVQDSALLEQARQAAQKIWKADTGLLRPEHVALRELVERQNAERALIADS
jgi:ATP-dependent DNA helicase RecG